MVDKATHQTKQCIENFIKCLSLGITIASKYNILPLWWCATKRRLWIIQLSNLHKASCCWICQLLPINRYISKSKEMQWQGGNAW